MLQQPQVALYAVYADPKELEAGHHPYWLVEAQTHPYPAPRGLKDGAGATITMGTYIVDVHWFICTSDDPNIKQYKKLTVTPAVTQTPAAGAALPSTHAEASDVINPIVHLPMKAFVTEVGLKWERYSPRLFTGTLSDASHLCIMKHNFSNLTS